MALRLRRWSERLLPEDELASSAAPTAAETGGDEPSAEEAILAGVNRPDSDSLSEGPPRHWAELVRRRAPDLLRWGRPRTVIHHATSPSLPPSLPREELTGSAAARQENPAPSSPPSGSPQLRVSEVEPARSQAAAEAPVERVRVPRPAPAATGNRQAGEELLKTRAQDLRPPPEAAAPGRTAAAHSVPPREQTVRSRAPSPEVAASGPSAGRTAPGELASDAGAIRQRQTPVSSGAATEETGKPRPARQPGGNPSRAPRILISHASADAEVSAIPSGVPKAAYRSAPAPGQGAPPRSVENSKMPVSATSSLDRELPGPESDLASASWARVQDRDLWPQLSGTAAAPVGAAKRDSWLGPETLSATAYKEPASATELSGLADGRWPELLEGAPGGAEGWTSALQSRERSTRLDAEQRGGD